MKKKNTEFPKGWNEARVQSVLLHYEEQTEAEALAEDEAARDRETAGAFSLPRSKVPEKTSVCLANYPVL